MNKKTAMKWIKALRSGKYIQGRWFLHTVDKDTKKGYYCCLGVAREIGLCVAQRGASQKLVANNFLPNEVQDKLVKFNDDRGWSFKQIANWIEENYEKF